MNQWCLVPFSISISSMVRFVVFFPRPAEWVRAWARNDRRQQPSDTPLNNHTGKAFHDALSIYHQFMAWVKNDLSAKWHSINNMDGKRERESRYANIQTYQTFFLSNVFAGDFTFSPLTGGNTHKHRSVWQSRQDEIGVSETWIL